MNVSLTLEEEAIVERLIASGRFASKNAVLKAALHLLQEDQAQNDLLRQEVKNGLDALARGDFKEYDREGLESLAEDIKRRGRKNLERTGDDQA